MPDITTPEILRDTLLKLLNVDRSLLGTYTLASGKTTPAIIIIDSGQILNSDRKIVGLECAIRRTPSSVPQYLYGGLVREYIEWQIHLLQWAGGKHTLREADSVICRKFMGTRSLLIEIPNNLNILEQKSLKIPVRTISASVL